MLDPSSSSNEMPASQGRHVDSLVAPVLLLAFPGEHIWHPSREETLVADAQRPIGHTLHASPDTAPTLGLNVPIGHARHIPVIKSLKNPASQGTEQTHSFPELSAVVPGLSHILHSDLNSSF
jgi:hypothetical protein